MPCMQRPASPHLSDMTPAVRRGGRPSRFKHDLPVLPLLQSYKLPASGSPRTARLTNLRLGDPCAAMVLRALKLAGDPHSPDTPALFHTKSA